MWVLWMLGSLTRRFFPAELRAVGSFFLVSEAAGKGELRSRWSPSWHVLVCLRFGIDEMPFEQVRAKEQPEQAISIVEQYGSEIKDKVITKRLV